MNTIGRAAYSGLSHDERFRLHLRAIARGDWKEAEWLSLTCPRETHKMNAAGYSIPVSAAVKLSWVFALLWNRAYGDFREARAFFSSESLLPDSSSDENLDRVIKYVRDLRGLRGGLDRFCESIGIETGDILAIIGDEGQRLEDEYHALEDMPNAEQDLVEAWSATFEHLWSEMT